MDTNLTPHDPESPPQARDQRQQQPPRAPDCDGRTHDRLRALCRHALERRAEVVIYLDSHIDVRGADPGSLAAILAQAREYETDVLALANHDVERLGLAAPGLIDGDRLRWPLEGGGWSGEHYTLIDPTIQQRAHAAILHLRSSRGLALRRTKADAIARCLEQLAELASQRGRG